ncbi:MAG: AAA family ATPase [Myxococcales bacterium]|nr:AAA family ATPase [Myxococcales bacterium]MCB9643832.1 AAA family ATPase [Myxococcales bacterium]
MKMDRWNHLKRLLGGLEQQFGRGLFERPMTQTALLPEAWPSGSWSMDQILGVGGYPKGRMVEIFGAPGTGKSTLALHAIQRCQERGGLGVYIDAEHSLDFCYAGALGVKLNELLVLKPTNAEQALSSLETLVKSGEIGVIVLDSIAALTPQRELEEGLQATSKFYQAQLISRMLRRLSSFLHQTPTSVLFVNQLRYRQQAPHLLQETTPGGHALKFYTSIRLELRHVRHLYQGERIVGQHIQVHSVKNKLSPPFREAQVMIRYGEGIDHCAEWFAQARATGLITRFQGEYHWKGSSMGKDDDTAIRWLRRDVQRQEQLQQQLSSPSSLCPKEGKDKAA